MLKVQKEKTKKNIHKALVKAYKATLPDSAGPDVDKFANKFADSVADVIADEIENMIKAQEITVLHTPFTLMSATSGSPVTGQLIIPSKDFKIN